MNQTVEWPVRSRGVAQADFLPWVNLEALPITRQLRQAANYTFRQKVPFITTAATGAFTALFTSPDIQSGVAQLWTATIMARAGTTARSAWIIRGLFYSDGTVTQEGATAAVYTQTVAAFAVRFQIVANHIEVQVQDNGVLSPTWTCVVEGQEHP